MAGPMLVAFGVGIFLRLWLFKTSVAEWLSEMNEISTPITSWKRVTEGLALHKAGISPYSGDLFHQMPLVLRILNRLNGMCGDSMHILFVVCDVVTAVVIERIAKHTARHLLWKQKSDVKTYSTDAVKLLLKSDNLAISQLYVVGVYMLNPYSIATCLAKSTSVFNNLAIAFSILFTLKGSRLAASLSIAVAAYLSFYPIMLVVPAAIFLSWCDHAGERVIQVKSVMSTLLSTLSALGILLYLSFILEGSWAFLGATYGFTLSVPDLTPNIGVFWYFFTEMFDHFRFFFICVFQINAFIYTVPLTVKLRDHPMFLMYVLVALMAVFKSYPSYADTALYLALLPIWRHSMSYMRNNFVVSVMFVVCSVLAPILYYLWIYAGSANANFYFAITLVYSTGQIFLITDLLFAYLRREYDMINGPKPQIINGQPAQVILD